MIYTHIGKFHADDALACAIAVKTGKFGGIEDICRIRSLEDIKKYRVRKDIVVDVGGVYDPKKNLFDHHQKGGSEDGRAAAGKVWAKYGDLISDKNYYTDLEVYSNLVKPVDDHDLGITQEKNSFGSFIAKMNPASTSEEVCLAVFKGVVQTMLAALDGVIGRCHLRSKAHDVVQKATIMGDVMFLSEGGPWQESVLIQNDSGGNINFVVFPSPRGGYMIQAVPDDFGSRTMRKLLPESWAELSGQDLAVKIPGVSTIGPALFCHKGRHLAGTETLKDMECLIGAIGRKKSCDGV